MLAVVPGRRTRHRHESASAQLPRARVLQLPLGLELLPGMRSLTVLDRPSSLPFASEAAGPTWHGSSSHSSPGQRPGPSSSPAVAGASSSGSSSERGGGQMQQHLAGAPAAASSTSGPALLRLPHLQELDVSGEAATLQLLMEGCAPATMAQLTSLALGLSIGSQVGEAVR
jgi:hypothetical protein